MTALPLGSRPVGSPSEVGVGNTGIVILDKSTTAVADGVVVRQPADSVQAIGTSVAEFTFVEGDDACTKSPSALFSRDPGPVSSRGKSPRLEALPTGPMTCTRLVNS